MNNLKIIFIIFFSVTSFAASTAHALILVEKGTYEVPAIIIMTSDGSQAIFNLMTNSEVRVLLTGKMAKKIKFDMSSKIYLIRFEVKEETIARRFSARLISFTDKDMPEFPLRVGNNFVPIKMP